MVLAPSAADFASFNYELVHSFRGPGRVLVVAIGARHIRGKAMLSASQDHSKHSDFVEITVGRYGLKTYTIFFLMTWELILY